VAGRPAPAPKTGAPSGRPRADGPLPRQHRLGLGGRLQEARDRNLDQRLAHPHRRRPRLDDDLAIERQPRRARALRQQRQPLGLESALGADGDVEAGVGRGIGHVAIADGRGDGMGQRHGALRQRRHQDRAGGDVEQIVAARLHVAHRLAAGMQRRPPSAVAMGGEHGVQRRRHMGVAQRVLHQPALQRIVGGGAEMLQRAAAAGAEIAAERVAAVFRLGQIREHPAL